METVFFKSMKATVCMGFVLTCILSPLSANAQDQATGAQIAPAVLSSTQQWKLQLVSAEEGQGVPFCAIYKEYEGQYELFLSMNPLGAMKILIKLAPGQYISGKAYNVTLALNNGYKKDFPKKEVYQDSIDLGLGKDPQFSDLIAKANLLSVKIDERETQFSVPDMGAAAKDLEYCISGGEMATDAAAMGLYDKPGRAAKQENSKTTKAQIDKTQTLLMGEERTPAVSSRSEHLSIDEKDLLESLKKKMVILEREKEILRTQLTDYRQDELTGLKEKMVTTQSVNDYEEKTRILEEKIKTLEQSKGTASCPAPTPAAVEAAPLGAKMDPEQAQSLNAEISTLKAQTAQLQKENADLKVGGASGAVCAAPAATANAGQLKSMETEVATLKEEAAKLTRNNAELEQRLAEAKANSGASNSAGVPEDVQYQLNYLQKQNQALEKQLGSCQ